MAKSEKKSVIVFKENSMISASGYITIEGDCTCIYDVFSIILRYQVFRKEVKVTNDIEIKRSSVQGVTTTTKTSINNSNQEVSTEASARSNLRGVDVSLSTSSNSSGQRDIKVNVSNPGEIKIGTNIKLNSGTNGTNIQIQGGFETKLEGQTIKSSAGVQINL